MKTSILLLAILIAAPALRAESTQTPPTPDFMTPTQLAVWSQQKHEKAMAAQAAQTAAQSAPGLFYTGKPYLAESGTYAFLARQYNPEMARWTTVDPSGFPDGPNNRVYAAVPTSELDPSGLYTATNTVHTSFTLDTTETVVTDTGTATFQYPETEYADVNIVYTITGSGPSEQIQIGGVTSTADTGVKGNVLIVNYSLGISTTYSPIAGLTPTGSPDVTVNWSINDVAALTFSIPYIGIDTQWGPSSSTPLASGSTVISE